MLSGPQLIWVAAIAMASVPALAQSRSVRDCDAVLIPTVEQTSDDYSRMQDYLYYNASTEYDRLQKLSTEQRSAEASYKVAQAEYNESQSASEFQEKLRSRISVERSQSQEATSSSNFRRGLDQAQVSAWAECAKAVGGGAVFLTADKVDPSAFPLTVRWFPATGQSQGLLTLKVANASIDGKSQVETMLVGSGSKPFIVKPDNTANPIVITAEILNSTDTVSLPRKFPAPTKAPVVCLRPEQVKRYSQDDNFAKAEPNYAPCFSHHGFTGRAPNIDAFYRISVLERGRLTITLRGTTETFELQLRNAKGEVVSRPMPKRGKNQSLEYTVTQPGEYIVRPQPITGPSDYDIDVGFSRTR